MQDEAAAAASRRVLAALSTYYAGWPAGGLGISSLICIPKVAT